MAGCASIVDIGDRSWFATRARRRAFYKMIAISRGANIVRREFGLPEAEIPANKTRYML